MIEDGHSVSHAHVRYLFPFPKNIEEVLRSFDTVLVPEMNMGQLLGMIRNKYLIDAVGLHKVQGKPFMIQEIETRIEELISNGKVS